MADPAKAPQRLFGLAESPHEPLVYAPWIGNLIALGCRLRRYLPKLEGRQLVLALSVPRRDYVSALIGSGWMISSPPPKLQVPRDVLLQAHAPLCLRAVTDKLIVTGPFIGVEKVGNAVRVNAGGKVIGIDRYVSVDTLEDHVEAISSDVPEPGYLARIAGADTHWHDRLAAPPKDLALVGTRKSIRQDLSSVIGGEASLDTSRTPLGTYVLPEYEGAATWSTPVVSAARLEDDWDVLDGRQAVILEHYGAIGYLRDVTSPIVVCVVDRSVMDESATDIVLRERRSNSREVSVVDDLGWPPAVGIEALAFTVAL